MSTTFAITDFSHGLYLYIADNQQNYVVSMRNVYATPSGLGISGTSYNNFPSKHARRRYIHSPSGGNTAPGHSVTRHFPVSYVVVQTPIAPGTIDGITDFVLKGYRGEQDRA